mmetsp:Transcript_36448/g.71725  ORF Transcript_36448/g.71725 Transcript_36448/m.71725 type:complete len:80 (-) Transcript_36448:353-592(-)
MLWFIWGKGDRGGHKGCWGSSVVILSPTSSTRLADKEVVGTENVRVQKFFGEGIVEAVLMGSRYEDVECVSLLLSLVLG